VALEVSNVVPRKYTRFRYLMQGQSRLGTPPRPLPVYVGEGPTGATSCMPHVVEIRLAGENFHEVMFTGARMVELPRFLPDDISRSALRA